MSEITPMWFGKSKDAIPKYIEGSCLMCEYKETVEYNKESQHQIFRKTCLECKRRSWLVKDAARWAFFFDFDMQCWEFFTDQYGTPYAYYHLTKRTMSIKSDRFQAIIRANFPIVKEKKLKEFISYCKGIAYGAGTKSLSVRQNRNNGEIRIDKTDGKCLVLTKEGWGIEELPFCTFRSPDHMAKFEAKEGKKEDWDKFRAVLNLETDDSRLLFEVWCASCFIPGIPHPILVPTGEQGAAKTTLCSITKNLIDPSVLSVMSCPETKEMALQMQERLVTAYDNITELSDDQTDMICQATTGFSYSKRALYTDGDSYARNLRSLIILNGINLPSARPDLVDRTIVLEVSRLTPQNRKTLEDVDSQASSLMARARGYLLTTVSEALKIYPKVKKEMNGKLPRMADWAIYAEAISRSMGYGSFEFLDAYKRNAEERTEEALAADSIADFLLELGNEEWSGSASELLERLGEMARDKGLKPDRIKDFPTAPNTLSRRLRVLKTTLSEKGIIFETARSAAGRKIKFKQIKTEAGQTSLGGEEDE